MTSSNIDNLEDFSLKLPITQLARQIAQQFASLQPTADKFEQVCLNTIAVYVVNDYLQMMGIPTNLSAGDSWNPLMRLCADVADLEVTGLGRLECRPLKMAAQSCLIPPEVCLDRIGYVMVQIDESYKQGTLLGFTQTVTTDELPISELRPLEDLIDCLHQLKQAAIVDASVVSANTTVNLSQWLDNIFTTGWQAVEGLFNPVQPDLAFSFRSADNLVASNPEASDFNTKRAKLIDLVMPPETQSVALIVEFDRQSEREVNILLQVRPTGNQVFLFPGVELIVLDESGATFLQAVARNADNYIQLGLSGEPGEQFSVKVAFGEHSFIEKFVI